MKFKLNTTLLLVLISSIFWLNDLNIKHITTLKLINLVLLFVILALICVNKIVNKYWF